VIGQVDAEPVEGGVLVSVDLGLTTHERVVTAGDAREVAETLLDAADQAEGSA